MTDKELDYLIAKYGGIVRAICRGILPGRLEDSEETEADTFLKLWRKKDLPSDELHLKNYVVSTARSCAIDKYRKLSRMGIELPLDDRDDAALAVSLESKLENEELFNLVLTLPPPDGELFLRRYLYGESASLLAARFKLKESTIRTKLFRAKEKLNTLLRKEGMI